jgi:hypothetical protein
MARNKTTTAERRCEVDRLAEKITYLRTKLARHDRATEVRAPLSSS